MSGHSHAKTIHKQKEATDQQRGRTFSKLSREIAIAARSGADPKTNFKLRLAMEKARQASMPRDNIERAVKKGSGELAGEKWDEIVFEGYGPNGIGMIVETATDNKNRTTAEIKNIFEKNGGSLASPGAVAFQFKKIGQMVVKGVIDDQKTLALIDFGAQDIQEIEGGVRVIFSPEGLGEARKRIEEAGFTVETAELTRQAIAPVIISQKESADKLDKFINALNEHDDVQKVYANCNFSQEIPG